VNRRATLVKILIVAMLLVLAVPAESIQACPNCREALAGSGRAIGYAASILLLMSAPFVMAGFWTTAIVRLRRNALRMATDPESRNKSFARVP